MKNVEIPKTVKEDIELYSSQYGKARLILNDTNYYIEPLDEETRKKLMDIPEVRIAERDGRERRIFMD
jgi:hypothetical protein